MANKYYSNVAVDSNGHNIYGGSASSSTLAGIVGNYTNGSSGSNYNTTPVTQNNSGTRVNTVTGYNSYGNSGSSSGNAAYLPKSNQTTGGNSSYTGSGSAFSGNGGSGSGSGSGSGGGSYSSISSSNAETTADNGQGAYLAYLQLIQAQQAAEQRRAEEAAAAQRAAAQAAYDRSMGYLNDAYNTQVSTLGDNYRSTVGQLNQSYDNSSNKITADALESLKQAYANKMLNEKSLGQAMAAQGLSGGAAESTLAKMYNNYGTSRNNIETTKANNLSELDLKRNDNLAQALQQYNSALADANAQKNQYAMNLENALANNQIAATENYQNALSNNNTNYLNALANAVSNMQSYQFDPTAATNDLNLATVIQAASNGQAGLNRNNYSAQVDPGANLSTINGGTNNYQDYLSNLLRSLYGV